MINRTRATQRERARVHGRCAGVAVGVAQSLGAGTILHEVDGAGDDAGIVGRAIAKGIRAAA